MNNSKGQQKHEILHPSGYNVKTSGFEALYDVRSLDNLITEFSTFRASYVSVLTVVAFSTERYIAICYPLYLRAISGLQRAIWIISGLWIVSFLCALPFAVHTLITYVYYPYNSTDNPLKVSKGSFFLNSVIVLYLQQIQGSFKQYDDQTVNCNGLLYIYIRAVIYIFVLTKLSSVALVQ